MTFWTSPLGALTGSEKDANSGGFTLIPNNTKTLAMINNFSLEETGKQGEETIYQVVWKVVDGAYKNAIVRQKIKAFDSDVEKRHKALNMMKRLYLLTNNKPTHDSFPATEDLAVMKGSILGVHIQEWHYNGNSGNWVCGVFATEGFVPEEGEFSLVPHSSPPQTALQRNAGKAAELDDDIPF